LFTCFAQVVGCKEEKKSDDKGGEATPSKITDAKPKAPETPAADATASIEACWAAFSTWDKDRLRACYPDVTEVTTVDATPPETAKTPQEVVVQVGVFRNAFPDFKSDLSFVVVNGKKAAAFGLLTGTHKGSSLGIPPTNKPISVFYAQILEFDPRSLIARERDYIDQATLLQQLGVHDNALGPAAEKPWPDKVRVVAANDAAEAANVEVVKKLLDATAKGDLDSALAAYADDATFRYITMADPFVGKQAVTEALKAYHQGNKLEITVHDVWGAGSWVVAETGVKGTLNNDLNEVAKAGKVWQLRDLEIFEVVGGKVKRHMNFNNGLKFMIDVGLFDPNAM
jgi:ketosteroid isomerase-like protein